MIIKINNLYPLWAQIKNRGFSESSFARFIGLSRLTLRALLANSPGARLSSWAAVAEGLEQPMILVSESAQTQTELSVQAVSYQVLQDDFSSWKIHFMNFVDEFRRHLDTRLILLPPSKNLDKKLQALLAAIVESLCLEYKLHPPAWCYKIPPLNQPWFVSESEALKPMMILESPLEFRKKNIFVGDNFLMRA